MIPSPDIGDVVSLVGLVAGESLRVVCPVFGLLTQLTGEVLMSVPSALNSKVCQRQIKDYPLLG